MASTQFLRGEQSRAQREGFETIQRLLEDVLKEEGPSERLSRAQRDVVGRNMPDFIAAMQFAELTRVVAAQQERIEVLEEQLAATQPAAPPATKSKATK